MKSVFVVFFLFVAWSFPQTALAQVLKPAKWTIEASKQQAKAGDEIEVVFKAKIDDNWYLYSNDFDPDCGPLLTEVQFNDVKNFELAGKLKAINAIAKHDETFDCDIRIFKKTAEFRQKIKLLGSPAKISGTIQGQVCTEVDGRCVPFEEDFQIDNIVVTGSIAPQKKTEVGKVDEKPAVSPTKEPEALNTVVARADSSKSGAAVNTTVAGHGKNTGPIIDKAILGENTEAQESSLFAYVLVAFVLGITSLITPCVFPMIPMTVTFFLKDGQSKKTAVRQAIVFGISIIVIYTVAGTLFAFAFGPEGLNALATHWLPNLFIFVLFIAFALSFLGLFEINAPYQLVNKADRAAEKGGLAGVFFMAATLVLVSFSCTLPLVGNVLVMAAGGQLVKPVLGMLAYSLAYAIPFALFAIFPGWLKDLPKSGGWLNVVKVSLGLFELAFALKFFSIADLTYQWGIMDRDLNIAIWIVIFSILGFYYLGKIRLPNDSPVEKVSVARLMLAIATFSFVIYLVPGLWGAPLKGLSGYLPPAYTHDFDLVALSRDQKNASGTSPAANLCETPKYSEFLHLPHGLKGYFDYDQALACARQQNKPLFIDFTGHGCTNCREMEANVWSDPQVLEKLKNDYVVVALYVDDKTELPQQQWYTSKHDNKVKKTIGKQNADLQVANLDNNAQPFYVLVGKDERVLAWPKAYDKSVKNFADFLESGKKTYQRLYLN